MLVSGAFFCVVREIMWCALGCSCVSAVCSRVCCACVSCVPVLERVVFECCQSVQGVYVVCCAWFVSMHGWLQCREVAFVSLCVSLVCTRMCQHVGECEVAREKGRFHKTRISHWIGATAATDGTCQLSASSVSVSTRYDVTSVETHDVGSCLSTLQHLST